MVGRHVLIALGMVAALNLAVGLLNWSVLAAVWSTHWVLTVGTQAVLFMVCFAIAITPEQRRDTRASAAAFRSGVVVVVVQQPAGPSLPCTAPDPPRPGTLAGGLPAVVPGHVIGEDEQGGRPEGNVSVTDERRTDETPRPYPPLQAEMAGAIEAGAIFYSAPTGRWFAGADGADEITGARGRALRTMLGAHEVAANLEGSADARRARPMTLTRSGRARLQATTG